MAEIQFDVRSEINVYLSDKDIEVTGQPIQTKIIAILKNPRGPSPTVSSHRYVEFCASGQIKKVQWNCDTGIR